MSMHAAWMAALVALWGGPAPAAYDVQVDLKNVSGEAKTDWPVILRVYTVFGRNLPPGSVDAGSIRVYDASGGEVACAIEELPPYDQAGNDEIVFVIPRIGPGETVRYRIACAGGGPGKRAGIDVVGSPHNLIADGGLEEASRSGRSPFGGPARIDAAIQHAGRASVLLAADNATVSARHAGTVRLHKGSWYYFGAWSRTAGVARFGYQAGGGGYVQLAAPDPNSGKRLDAFDGQVTPQCSTRDWLKVALEGAVTDWGMDRYAAQATCDEAELELSLRQRKHYYMEQGRTAGSWWLDDLVLIEQPEVTVRFDLALQPLMEEGVFLFTRPPHTYLGQLATEGRPEREWCSYPYPHERLQRLEKLALRGQRATFCVGIYHTREVPDAVVRVAGGGLSAGEAKLPVEVVEYLPGFAGQARGRYMTVLGEGGPVEPVTLAGDKGVRYFFLTFHVPPQARPGRYTGQVEVLAGDRLLRAVPAVLRVQDLLQPAPQDAYVGIIFQGSQPPFNDEALKVYSRSGFTCLTRFGSFLSYAKDGTGKAQVDLDKLRERMTWLKGYGLTGVCVFSDFDLGPKWNGGALLKQVRPRDFNEGQRPWGERLQTAEEAWKAQVRRIEQARKEHPEWPTFIYMTWDEPSLGGGVNGRPDPAMAWLNQVAPDALTTLDVQFDPLAVCAKWYTAPAFDDPASWAGPELYRWVHGQGKRFGFCGSAREEGDSCRYQSGIMIVTTGASYFHAWHLGRPEKMAQNMALDKPSGRVLRAVSMINWGAGMDDLKAHRLLLSAIAEARRSADPARLRAAQQAEEYLRGVLAVWNGDHKPTWPNEPYLGNTSDWGCERFYDDWQEQMARRAAALTGTGWVE